MIGKEDVGTSSGRSRKLHPEQTQVDMIGAILENITEPGAKVLDPCL